MVAIEAVPFPDARAILEIESWFHFQYCCRSVVGRSYERRKSIGRQTSRETQATQSKDQRKRAVEIAVPEPRRGLTDDAEHAGLPNARNAYAHRFKHDQIFLVRSLGLSLLAALACSLSFPLL